MPTEMKRRKHFKGEIVRPKQIVADLSLDRKTLQDVIRRKLVRK